MKSKIALVRGKFLNKFELQFYEPLVKYFDILGIGSKTCFCDKFSFPVVKLNSPVDLPEFPYKMPVLNRLFIDANFLFGLEKYLIGIDIAHSAETYYHFTIQCLNAKKKGLVKKVIVSVFENIPFAAEGIWGRKHFKTRVRKEADHLIAVSQKSKQALIKEGFQPDKISVINQHIDTNRFLPVKARPGKEEIVILFTGRLEEYKGVFDFVRAAEILIKDPLLKKRKLKFLMVGGGSCLRELLQLENELGIEKYFEHKESDYDRMPIIYQQADIYIAPSKTTRHWQEQFSTVLLEAKASGLPIISTDSGGIPENVGKAGVLVREGDFQAIALEARKLILDGKLRSKYGKQARQDALDRFTIEQGADKVKEVYQKILSSK